MAAANSASSTEDLRSAPPKCLYKSPQVIKREISDSDVTDEIVNNLQIEEDTQKYLALFDKELHKERLDSLRSQLNEISKDDWMYPSVNKLIGNR